MSGFKISEAGLYSSGLLMRLGEKNINSIVGFDTGIRDNIYFLNNDFFESELKPYLKTLLPDKDFDKSKIEIPSRDIIKKIKFFLTGRNFPTNFTYGGTTANIFYNLSEILGNKMSIKFVATGKDSLDDLKKRNIQIFLSEKSSNYAESVLIYLGTNRSKRTLIYRGDFKKVIEENLDEAKPDIFHDNALYMLMGSVLGKIGRDNFSKILQQIRKTKNSIYTLNLPTDKDTSINYNSYILELMESAHIIFSNLEELCFIFAPELKESDCFENYQPNNKAKEIIVKLQKILSENSHAMITAGEFGAFLIFKNEYIFSQAKKFEGKPYSNGAGDTTIGSYLSLLLLGYNHKAAFEAALKCAFEKLKFNNSRLPDIKRIALSDF